MGTIFFLLLFTFIAWHAKVGAAELHLTWTDTASNEDGFRIERKMGTQGTFTQMATVGANITSYTDSGLVAGKTYCYRVQAFNVAGNSSVVAYVR
jgi:hypothetical protein